MMISSKKWNISYILEIIIAPPLLLHSPKSFQKVLQLPAALNGQDYENLNDKIQGVCLNGWHVPSDTEWFELETFLEIDKSELNKLGSRGQNEGGKLKQKGYSLWKKPNVGATNEVFYNTKPVGYFLNGKFDRKGLEPISGDQQ
ncbi:MAG: hypothetical protein COA50_11110 [Flavobacteriaceae bacterium]|nr:MAG: hypothetical protein COA50_11110 [Flavobacteriaceae bacterium]